MSGVFLVSVVEVSKEKRIVCQAPGCGRAVYRRIHIVLVDNIFSLLGSDCFERLYGSVDQVHTPYYDWSHSRQLTDEERERLVKNTAEFIEQLEAERIRREEELLKAQQTTFIKPAVHAPLATIVPTAPHQYYNVHDPSALPYEGSAALQWVWNTDRSTRAANSGLTDPAVSQDARTILELYEKTKSKTPYFFALDVELRCYLPKSMILRTLHELYLIKIAKDL